MSPDFSFLFVTTTVLICYHLGVCAVRDNGDESTGVPMSWCGIN